MLVADYLEEIVWSFRKQRLRTALTSFGIAIGAFAITIMVGLGQGVQSYIEAQVRAFGNPRVVIVFPDFGGGADRLFDQLARVGKPAQPIDEGAELERRRRRGGVMISPEQVDKLRHIDGVERVSPMTFLELDGIALARDLPEGATRPAVLYETDFGALWTHPLAGKPSAGRLPSDDAPDEVALSPQYAESFHLHPEELLGKEVVFWVPRLGDVAARFLFRDPTKFKDEHRLFRARIVGLVEHSPASRSVYMSLALGRETVRYQSGNPELLSEERPGIQAYVRIAEGHDVKQVKAEIRKLGLAAKGIDEALQDIGRSFLVVKLALSLFGMIAVLVATLGIANTLLMAISERTREIGVMKALGATEATIRAMFAAEAAAIGLVGGVVGVAGAIALGEVGNVVARRYLDSFEEFTAFAFPAWLLLGALAFSMLIGALAGLYPANRAARLDPIEALRHE
ncbi:MAG TPA: ABC transporter permease [Planctomycetota bacterium]|nr:ABC transporter permease [Planctomycetota bacterium]